MIPVFFSTPGLRRDERVRRVRALPSFWKTFVNSRIEDATGAFGGDFPNGHQEMIFAVGVLSTAANTNLH